MPSNELLMTVPLLLILVVATIMDWHRHRITNVLSFGATLFGLILQATVNGASGVLIGAGGWLVCLIFLLPFYAKGGMAAGDVKLMAAVGVFLGPIGGFFACVFTLVAGGLIGLASIGVAWGRSRLATASTDRHFTLDEARRTRIPYAGAIAAGTSFVLLVPGVIPASFT